MGGMSPGGGGLIPVGDILFDGDGGVVEGSGYFLIGGGASLGGDVPAHVHGGKVTFVFARPLHFNFIYYYF